MRTLIDRGLKVRAAEEPVLATNGHRLLGLPDVFARHCAGVIETAAVIEEIDQGLEFSR